MTGESDVNRSARQEQSHREQLQIHWSLRLNDTNFFQWERQLQLNLLYNGISYEDALDGTISDKQTNNDVVLIIIRGLEPKLALKYRKDQGTTVQALFQKIEGTYEPIYKEFELDRLRDSISILRLTDDGFLDSWITL